ncbi:hypothetical protein NCS55_01484600 [Fusarium keratoplasticum]|nr:hypothetical protein NCS55_01484600 [Fusarium keratoplasticum]
METSPTLLFRHAKKGMNPTPSPKLHTPLTLLSQNRTPASLVLNRENQRRSRARHREFINDLQRRVFEYERRDAQATLEMQQVARAVAAENAALREMLAARNVTREEVDAYLASSIGGVTQDSTSQARSRLVTRPLFSKQAVVDGPRQEKPGSLPFQNAMGRSAFSEQRSPPTVALSGRSPGLTRMAARTSSSLALSIQAAATPASQDGRTYSHSPLQESSHDSYKQEPQRPANSHLKQNSGEHTTCARAGEPDVYGSSFDMLSIDPACYCPPETPQGRSLTSNGMPCLDAAIILAQLRGHPDSTLARAELGCAEGIDCVVRNTDVLQLMDEMT